MCVDREIQKDIKGYQRQKQKRRKGNDVRPLRNKSCLPSSSPQPPPSSPALLVCRAVETDARRPRETRRPPGTVQLLKNLSPSMCLDLSLSLCLYVHLYFFVYLCIRAHVSVFDRHRRIYTNRKMLNLSKGHVRE